MNTKGRAHGPASNIAPHNDAIMRAAAPLAPDDRAAFVEEVWRR
jgi:hypothetical protein